MPSITAFVASFVLLITSILALTDREIELGRVPGFIHPPFPTHTGDYLDATFCFCATPEIVLTEYSEANYFQLNYYNSHQNTTYILTHLCLAYQVSEITCLAPRAGHGLDFHSGLDFNQICRTWYNDIEETGVHLKDTLCYEVAKGTGALWREFRLPGPDLLTFNGQKRRLNTVGRQGPVLRTMEEADEKCEALCQRHAKMPLFKGSQRAQSHIMTWEDLDDMCPHCK